MNPNIVPYGYKAYLYAYNNKITDREYFVFVDFSLPSNQKRLFVVNKNKEVVYSTYVAHGSGSGKGAYANRFSNTNNSHMSSIGVYKTLGTYVGKHGLSRRVEGLEYTNDGAQSRAVVIHSAKYIGDGQTGNSWGCFAVPVSEIDEVLSYTLPRTIIIAYYPDKEWIAKSKFLK